MAEVLICGKKVEELKVTELKEELGKRGLQKYGKKQALVKRLIEYILTEQFREKSSGDQFSGDGEGSPTDEQESEETNVNPAPLQTGTSQVKSQSMDFLALELDPVKEDLMDTANIKLKPSIDAMNSDQVQSEAFTGFGGEDSSQRSLEKCDSEEFSLSLPLDDDTTSEKMDLSTPLEDEITEETANDHQDKVTERLESVSSVLIEPSCTDQPEEELIYEGDVEVEETNMDIDEDTTPVDDEPQDELEVHCPVIDFETESEKAASDKPTTSVVSAPNNTRIAKVVKSPKPAVVKKPITAQIKAPGGAADGGISSSSCSVWVSGLAPTVSASDLKTLFSRFGTVTSAKLVARAHFKNQRFGYITLTKSEQARKCVVELNKIELKGRRITVEIARTVPLVSPSKPKTELQGKLVKPPEKKEEIPNSGNKGIKKPEEKVGDRQAKNIKEPSKSATEITSPRRSLGPSKRIVTVNRDGRKELVRIRGDRRSEEGPPIRRRRSRSRSRSPIRERRSFPGSSLRGRIVSRLSPPPPRGDFRSELYRREREREMLERRAMERGNIHHRLGERIEPRALEMRIAEQRERHLHDQERERLRERDMMRRQMEVEHRQREQELAQQLDMMKQREAHERHLYERQRRQTEEQQRLVEQREREIRDRERQVKEAEMRERERLSVIEKQREKEFRDRERRYREELEREIKEKERQLRAQEKELRDRERKMREEQERQAKMIEEQERHRRLEEEQRRREEEERKERERRIREQELKIKKEEQELVAKRLYSPQLRADPIKRLPQMSGSSPESSSVFGRLGGRDNGGTSSRSNVVKETAISPSLTYRRYEATRSAVSPYTQAVSSRQKDTSFGGYSSPGAIGYPPLSSRPGSSQSYNKTGASVGYGSGASSSSSSYTNSAKPVADSKVQDFISIASKALSQIAASSQAAGGTGGGSYSQLHPNPTGTFFGAPSGNRFSGHGGAVAYPHPHPPPFPPPPNPLAAMGRPPSSAIPRMPPKLPVESMRYNRRMNFRSPTQKKGMNY